MQNLLLAFCKGVMVGFWFLAAVVMLPFVMIAAIADLLFGERGGHF